jgi:3-hydroxyacyl-CoA dehydrogenase/enoyl-CoA hydratase/3-hydroxybutyryl-CoA epimerase
MEILKAVSAGPVLDIDARGIGWITFDDPGRKVNVLTADVMHRLARAVEAARKAAVQGRVRVLVIRSGKSDSFLAGADLDAIAALEDPGEAERAIRLGQAVFGEVERLPVPTVCAIHGDCLGGGLELALACRHRVASDSPRPGLAFPEVLLGILPAWGGTTRLPRLVGLQASLDILLTGKEMGAHAARRIGLVSEVFPVPSFQETVAEFALHALALPARTSRPKRGLLTRLLDETPPGRNAALALARRRVLARTGGHYPAPLRILDILRDHLGGDPEDSLDAEARLAGALLVGTVSKNLVHVFRMREAARKGKGVTDASVEPGRVAGMAVLGAGVMGAGIAHLAASRGVRVRLKDVRHEAVLAALRQAQSLFGKAVERGKLPRREAAQAMELISGGVDWSAFGSADLVVETVVERLEEKRAVLREAESRVSSTCILATNTSSLSVDALAEGLDHPERVCGLHFFNPVHRMPLVEVVRGPRTSDQVVATAYAFVASLGKVPVVVRDGPGFVVNRVLAPYLNEAGWLLADGARVEEVDRAAREFGMPMGPLRLLDEVGIAVATHAGTALHEALGERLAPSPALAALGAAGRPGRQGGRGLYRYEKGREKGVDGSVYADLGAPVPPRRGGRVDPEEIRRRLLAQMINEAARVLADGVVRSAPALDLAMVLGAGFPPFRGGLLRFADTLHPRGVLDRTLDLQDRLGDRFAPAPLLRELARDNLTFHEAFPG